MLPCQSPVHTSLPLATLHPLVLFGTAPSALTLPALALTFLWFAVLVIALLRDAELELEMLRGAG